MSVNPSLSTGLLWNAIEIVIFELSWWLYHKLGFHKEENRLWAMANKGLLTETMKFDHGQCWSSLTTKKCYYTPRLMRQVHASVPPVTKKWRETLGEIAMVKLWQRLKSLIPSPTVTYHIASRDEGNQATPGSVAEYSNLIFPFVPVLWTNEAFTLLRFNNYQTIW